MMISCILMYKWGFDEALSVPSLVFLYNTERNVKNHESLYPPYAALNVYVAWCLLTATH
jgi:hypothetical protein